ncbi:hypothetical protein GCM10010914_31540 [Deinococcus wulumuqiensis]|uniref:Uncharacterized protein n=1 Tax=Deinococcus wulumuqiensis TaxID=980427 RepID=A0AAV4KBC8_9DEIO|nr:hypothetical protein GCM10008021_31090 [Deinococcus wulumuqiensis]GGI94672.1 hypothetical protein GCM10010914_31540 [Deinococcus wulumuqiensis]
MGDWFVKFGGKWPPEFVKFGGLVRKVWGEIGEAKPKKSVWDAWTEYNFRRYDDLMNYFF